MGTKRLSVSWCQTSPKSRVSLAVVCLAAVFWKLSRPPPFFSGPLCTAKSQCMGHGEDGNEDEGTRLVAPLPWYAARHRHVYVLLLDCCALRFHRKVLFKQDPQLPWYVLPSFPLWSVWGAGYG